MKICETGRAQFLIRKEMIGHSGHGHILRFCYEPFKSILRRFYSLDIYIYTEHEKKLLESK